MKANPKAKEATDAEWGRLRTMHTWDEYDVHEWRDMQARLEKSHVGRIFEICVEKGSELPEGHPDRKF